MKHKWKLDEMGEIDNFAFEYEYHNGPVCERCGFTLCMYCQPEGWDDESCPETMEEYNE